MTTYGYLIDPENRTITQHTFTTKDPFREAKALMGTDMAEVVKLKGRDTLLVDEDGRLKAPRHYFVYMGYPQLLVGKSMYTQSFGKRNPKATLEQVVRDTRFLSEEELRDMV
jgi:hypothetical protein